VSPDEPRKTQHEKRRLNFATFIIKERLSFPADNQYHVDFVTYVNFMTKKNQRSIVANIESRFPLLFHLISQLYECTSLIITLI
jgi:hypothetical protein